MENFDLEGPLPSFGRYLCQDWDGNWYVYQLFPKLKAGSEAIWEWKNNLYRSIVKTDTIIIDHNKWVYDITALVWYKIVDNHLEIKDHYGE